MILQSTRCSTRTIRSWSQLRWPKFAVVGDGRAAGDSASAAKQPLQHVARDTLDERIAVDQAGDPFAGAGGEYLAAALLNDTIMPEP